MPDIPHLMRAAIAEAVGEPQRLVHVSTPRPRAGEVLVRVMASAVNPLDVKILAGVAEHARQPLPAILGIDMAGIVAAVGSDAPRFREGDAVFGMTGGVGDHPGSLAEYVSVDERLLALKPANLSLRETAGREIIERLGARFVDKEDPPAAVVARDTGNQGFDIVFDTAGGESLDRSFAMVRRFGHVVSTLGWGAHSLAPLSFRAASYSGIFTLLPLLTGEGCAHHGEILAEATRLAEAGALVPGLDPRHFTLGTVGDAYRLLEAGMARGKLVIDVGEEVAS